MKTSPRSAFSTASARQHRQPPKKARHSRGGGLSLFFALLIVTGREARADEVNVSFTAGSVSFPITAEPGIVPGANWNNVDGSSGSNVTLSDNKGSGTPVLLSFTSTSTYGGFSPTSTPNAATNQLYSKGLVGNATFSEISVTLSHIPYSSYSAYVYASQDTSLTNTLSITNGTTTYYYNSNGSNNGAATSLQLVTSTNPASPTTGPGNYELFTNLTGSTFTLLTGGSINGVISNNLFGFQIVDTSTGPLLQNSPPVGIPTTADFIVIGPVQTGGPTDNNTVHTLTFTPGSSLHIYNNLTVTLGPVILPGGASITLDGSLTVNQLQMLFGSLLNGNGSIIGDLINSGVLSPGHSPGQINVTGNYVQTSQGTLQIEIGGRHTGQFDVLAVAGKASLNGTLAIVPLYNFQVRRGDTFRFLTAGQGVSGQFANVVDGFATDTILNPVVVYHQNDVTLEVPTFESFANTWNLTPNQKSVARALDSTNYDSRANNLISYLESRNVGKLPGDFDKIAPEELTSVFTLGVSLANVQSQNIQRRTDDIRSGSNGFNAANLALNGNGPSYSGSFGISTGVAGPNGSAVPSGDDGKAVKETKAVVPAENRWGVFLSGTGEWVSVGDTDNARGYNLESGGFTLGVDYKVTPNLAIGLAGGYTGTTADLTQGGRIYVNGGKIGLYGTFFQNEQPAPTMSKDSSKDSSKEAPTPAPSIAKGFYADVAVFGGYNSYDTRRSALQGTARGDTDGGELNALFGAGYDFKKGGLTFGPTATFNYSYVGTNEFTEHGSLAPLTVHGGKGESLRTAFGLKASYDWKVGGIVIKPELRAAWQHEYGDSAYALDSSFANGAGNSFLVNGPELGRDSALLGAGFALQLNERTSFYTYYDGELGRKNYQATNVTGGFRFAF